MSLRDERSPTRSESGCISPTLLPQLFDAALSRTSATEPTTAAEKEVTLQVPPQTAAKSSAKSTATSAPSQSTAASSADSRIMRSASPAGLSTELTLKVMTQMSRVKALTQVSLDIHAAKQPLPVLAMDDHLSTIESIHKAFLKEHSYFEVTWPRKHLNHEYFATDMFMNESSLYSRLKTSLLQLKARYATPASSPGCSTGSRTETDSSNKLPELTMPIFKGNLKDWPSFKELFTVLILNNTTLDEMQKLQYLRVYVQGPVAQLISTLPLQAGSLAASLKLLTDRYENKRALIQSHLDTLIGLRSLPSNSAAGLQQLHDQITEAVQSLAVLNMAEKLGDCLVITMAAQCLDRSTRVAWETSTSSSTEYPTLKGFLNFIATQSRAMGSVERATAKSATSFC